MSTESTILRRPDHFLVALIINKPTMKHVRTVVGHYSEHLPQIDLLDSDQKNLIYLELGGDLLVFLQNCLKSRKDFAHFYNLCFEQGITINMNSIFIDLHNLCDHYTALKYNPKFKVHPQVYRDVVKTRYLLTERSNQFNLNRITTPYHHIPIELGMFLQSVRAG